MHCLQYFYGISLFTTDVSAFLIHVMLVAHLRDRGATSHFSEGEQRPGVVSTHQLSNTAFHKLFRKGSRNKSYTGSSCMKSEQSPFTCIRSHVLQPLPAATSAVKTVQQDLPWSQRTSVTVKKPRQIIKFGLQEMNISYHSPLHVSSTFMSGNVTYTPTRFTSYRSSSSQSHDPIKR